MCFERGCSDSVRSSSDNQIQRYVESVYPSNNLSHDMKRQIENVYDPRPRGSWKLKAMYALGAIGKRTVAVQKSHSLKCNIISNSADGVRP